MTISEQSRHQLHRRLEEILGVDDAATLMEHLPPVGWADVATKRDLDHCGAQLRADVRADLFELRTELKEEIAGMRVDLHQELGGLRGEMGRQQTTLLLGLAGLQVSGAALVVAASRLL